MGGEGSRRTIWTGSSRTPHPPCATRNDTWVAWPGGQGRGRCREKVGSSCPSGGERTLPAGVCSGPGGCSGCPVGRRGTGVSWPATTTPATSSAASGTPQSSTRPRWARTAGSPSLRAAARATHTRVNQRTGRNTSKGFASSVVLKTGSQPSGTPIRGASCPRSSVTLFSECYLSVRLVSSST